jgi:quercetin dioxygenase-like cupin family protein
LPPIRGPQGRQRRTDQHLEYRVDGQPPVILQAGGVLFIPAGTIHAARNVGSGNAAELATYIVVKGQPLVVRAR